MPIIRERYSENWKQIVAQVKHEANWCCEHCQRPCRQPSELLADLLLRTQRWRLLQLSLPAEFTQAPRRYLLTVAHNETLY